MEQARMDRALNRIEGALDRIASAARKAASNATQAAPPGHASDETLRARVAAALSDLDELIAELER